MKNTPPCVLTIAGTDPTGGAGIQADIKTISANGCYAASVITALVAQNTQGVQAIEVVAVEFIRKQMHAVFSDLNIIAVKIGMLHNSKIMETVADVLTQYKAKNIVLDPVMVAKNGCELLQKDAVSTMQSGLFPLADLITPNLSEAEVILAKPIRSFDEMALAASEMSQQFNVNVLLKGGHLVNEDSSDVLSIKNQLVWFHEKRIDTNNTHGTGCTLSAAIASYLARGEHLPNAIKKAKQYLTNAIRFANHQIGYGFGPVNHFYFLEDI